MVSFKDILAKILNRGKTLNGSEAAIHRFQAIFDLINSFTYIVGIEFTSDWKNNARATAFMISNLFLFWQMLYSMYFLFPGIACVELSAGMAVFFTVQVKFSFFLFNHARFMSLVDFIYEVAHRCTDRDRKRIMIDTSKTIFYHFKLIFGGYCFGLSLYVSYPFYDYFINGKLTPMSPMILPFTKDDTVRNYWIGTLSDLTRSSWNAFCVVATSWMFMTCVDVYAGLISLIENDLNKFDGMWTKECKNHKLRDVVVFRNIMMEIMDLAKYNAMMRDLFGFIATMEVGSSFFAIATLLFAILANDYFGGMGGALFCASGLVIYCYIGQALYDQTERIEMVIVHTDWYLYDCSCQRDLMVVALYIVQNMAPVAVADIIPLNFETGVMVAKNIYSILMFLLNTLQ